jgi:hypothetical protein
VVDCVIENNGKKFSENSETDSLLWVFRVLKHNHRTAGAGMMLVEAVWVDGLL